MRMIGKISFIGLFVLGLFTADASATLTGLLPESSHYQGSTYYDNATADGFLRGRIDFAVYDTLGGNEYINAGYLAPGDGRFIYAYQIFNDYLLSDEAVAYFSLLGVSQSVIDCIGSEQDPQSGVEPSDAYCAATEAVWKFDDQLVYSGQHSWFLVLSSNTDWVAGQYEIKTNENDDLPVPIPEPTAFALFAFAGAIIFKKRKIPAAK